MGNGGERQHCALGLGCRAGDGELAASIFAVRLEDVDVGNVTGIYALAVAGALNLSTVVCDIFRDRSLHAIGNDREARDTRADDVVLICRQRNRSQDGDDRDDDHQFDQGKALLHLVHCVFLWRWVDQIAHRAANLARRARLPVIARFPATGGSQLS